MKDNGPRKIKVALALLSLYIIWGSTYLAIRISLETFPPFFMAGVRFFAVGLALYLFLRLRGERAPSRQEWTGASIVGGLLLLGGNGGVVFAEQWVASGLAAIAVATVPLWTVLFGWLWKRRPSVLEWAGVVLGFIGVMLLNLGTGLGAHPAGAVALILSAIFWSFGSAWSRSLRLPSGLMASAAEMLSGGLLLLAVSIIAGEGTGGAHTLRSTGAVLYLMVFGSLVGFSAYTYLLANVRASLATSYAYVNPAVAVTLGAVFAGESITAAGAAAIAMIITAVVLVIVGQREKRHSGPEQKSFPPDLG